MQLLNVAAFLALAPQLLATAAVIADLACFQGLVVRLLIHICKHQHVTRFNILGDGWDQVGLAKVWTTHRLPFLAERHNPRSDGSLGAN